MIQAQSDKGRYIVTVLGPTSLFFGKRTSLQYTVFTSYFIPSHEQQPILKGMMIGEKGDVLYSKDFFNDTTPLDEAVDYFVSDVVPVSPGRSRLEGTVPKDMLFLEREGQTFLTGEQVILNSPGLAPHYYTNPIHTLIDGFHFRTRSSKHEVYRHDSFLIENTHTEKNTFVSGIEAYDEATSFFERIYTRDRFFYVGSGIDQPRTLFPEVDFTPFFNLLPSEPLMEDGVKLFHHDTIEESFLVKNLLIQFDSVKRHAFFD